MRTKGIISFYFALISDIFYRFKKKKKLAKQTKRKSVESNLITVYIHEWGGYKLQRIKHIPKIKEFECGLFYQLLRFNRETLLNLKIYVTISEIEKLNTIDKNYIENNSDKIIPVSNTGMDFSGYAVAYDMERTRENHYIILTNSSVNAQIDTFLNDYIEYMENNQDVGALGISCNSRYTQTLFKNNFSPHIQSFFILTTVDVLDEIVKLNKGQFPGINIIDKRLLIREGEVKFSQLVLDLGYKISVVLESGRVYKFDCNTPEVEFPFGDMRMYSNNPNKITPISKEILC